MANPIKDKTKKMTTVRKHKRKTKKGSTTVKAHIRDKAYKRYRRSVNMTRSELNKWAKNPCSKKASLDRGPINRNLHLLSTPKSEWGPKEIKWARKTIGFNARMSKVKRGKPVSKNCKLSKRDISLKNWARDPNK